MTYIYRAIAALCTIGALAAFSASPALAHRGHVFGPSLGGPGSGVGQLSLTSFSKGPGAPEGGSGLAVNELTHSVYIADTGNNRVDEFTSAGAFVRAWGWGVRNGASEFQICTETTGCRAGLAGIGPGQFKNAAFVAVDDTPGGEGNVYVADYHEGEGPENLVQKFTAEGALIETWGTKGQLDPESTSAKFALIGGIAVTPAGDLLIGSGQGFSEFSGSGIYIEKVSNESTEAPSGFAIDGSGNFYYDIPANAGPYRFNIGTGEFSELWRTNGVFFTGLAVSKGGELYLDEGNAIQVIASSCISLCSPSTTFTSPLLTKGVGLAVDSQREVVYIAETAADKIESIVPEPPAAPLVEVGSQSVSDVSGDSATLEAAINPRSEPDEEPTSYYFQYTTDERFQHEGFDGASSIPVPDGQLAPNYEADLVTARVQGLAPATTYHYRVIAENAISRREGKPTDSEPDGSGNEVIRTFVTQPAGVFSLLDGRAWELVSPANKHGALIGFNKSQAGNVQAADDGGALAYLASAPTEGGPPGAANATHVLSARTAGSWVSRDINTPSDTAKGGDIATGERYWFFFSSDLSSVVFNPFGPFVPGLSTETTEQTPYLRTNYVGGDREDPCVNSCYRPLVTSAPGFANVPEGTEFGEDPNCVDTTCGPQLLGASSDDSHILLGESKVPLTEGAPPYSLYEWGNGELQLVSVLPEGAPVAGSLGSDSPGKENVTLPVLNGAVSADGSRIVWSLKRGGTQYLYLRDVVQEETVELGAAGASFETASADVSRVYFVSGGDLWVFESSLGSPLSNGHATDLTPGGEMREMALGTSKDGSSVYFAARAVLTSAPSPNGEMAQAGQPNLYVYSGGTVRLVAVLSSEDAPDWGGKGGIMPSARVSPDGRWLAFMSDRPLTGYDNRDVSSGVPDEEVFLYDASGNSGEGALVCASCDPTGARPHGVVHKGGGSNGTLLVDGNDEWGNQWLAANIPAWASLRYQARYLADSGRLFFNSSDALAPSDTNGTEDVYEYEPAGVGNCSSAVALFRERSRGCVDLVSSGTAKEESVFLDASENGDDVFFLTSSQLSSLDTDIAPDVYDARVDGGFPVPQPPPACEGDACQSPVASPNDQTPGSLTYRGPGNPQPLLTPAKTTKKRTLKCSKGHKPSRGKCVKVRKKAKKVGAVRRARVGVNRGAKS